MNYYDKIKTEFIKNEVYKKAKDYSKNKSDLETYYKVGKLLVDAGKHYGEGVVKEYSKRLTLELGSGYGLSNLKRMRQFYYVIEKGVAMPHQLSWSHILILLPINDIIKINYYIDVSTRNNLSYRELRKRIKSKEYERLDENTKNKLIIKEKINVSDFIKNPIVLNNLNNYDISKEYSLKQLILEDISHFLEQLGYGFSFIKDEYKIKIGDNYNYIDLLLFNYIYNCFIVVEFKVTKLKKEHIGQIEIYMNYIDNNVRSISQDKTIGVIICLKDNKAIIEYCSNPRIFSTTYKLETI